jgi:adenosylcobinamide-GDP ribazoletransferase
VLAPVPAPTVALAYVLVVVALTGINHADGVADLGDAAVVHGDAERRHEVLGDTVLGVGGTLALALVVAGLALAGLGLASLPVAVATGLVVVAEVGAKCAMALLATLGDPAHEGFGAAVAGDLAGRDLALPLVLTLPAPVAVAVLAGAGGAVVALVALAGGLATALALLWWVRRTLGGVTGDVFGAGNELVRVVALHAGLVAWQVTHPLAGRLPEVVGWTLS